MELLYGYGLDWVVHGDSTDYIVTKKSSITMIYVKEAKFMYYGFRHMCLSKLQVLHKCLVLKSASLWPLYHFTSRQAIYIVECRRIQARPGLQIDDLKSGLQISDVPIFTQVCLGCEISPLPPSSIDN